MYDEIKQDLGEQFKDFPKKKAPRWGEAIKALIEEKKGRGEAVSVQSLSKKTGMNEKHLFNILAQRVQDPASDKLVKIADALGVSFAELATRAMGEWVGSFFICGFGQRGFIEYSQHGFSIQSLSPPGTSERDFFMGLMTIKPYKELKKWKFKDNSMICVFLQQGTLEITYGNKIRRVHANESAYFDGGIPHKFRNIDSIEAKLFLVTRPPIH
jgi:mannose-6-phosphate isomerase-like protein (cupin superfamily)